jgi:hypothetical protein
LLIAASVATPRGFSAEPAAVAATVNYDSRFAEARRVRIESGAAEK